MKKAQLMANKKMVITLRVKAWGLALLAALGCLAGSQSIRRENALAEEPTITIISADGQEVGASSEAQTGSSLDINAEDPVNQSPTPQGSPASREALIDQMIGLAQETFEKTNGRAQRAHYSGDIYVCKNFTVYLFREFASGYRIAEFPDVPLIIPDNQKKDDCKPYVYGVEWKDIPASEGNPFYAAATFRYDDSLSKDENWTKAREFLMQVRRGDYFQMAAKYYYGTGAHSMVFIADYVPETDSVHWTDSNMKGKKVGDERYGYVQYDAVREIDWFVDAFCRKGYGATLYRLRDDIILTP